MNGYNGESAVLLDDIRAGSIDFEVLLSITDGYPHYVNVNGSFREWMAEIVVITAPKRPEVVFYDTEKDRPWDKVDQLLRRIDHFRNFDDQPYGTLPEDGQIVQPEPEGAERTEVVEEVERGEPILNDGDHIEEIHAEKEPTCEEAELEEEVSEEPWTEVIPLTALPQVSVDFDPLLDKWFDGEKYVRPVKAPKPPKDKD